MCDDETSYDAPPPSRHESKGLSSNETENMQKNDLGTVSHVVRGETTSNERSTCRPVMCTLKVKSTHEFFFYYRMMIKW